MQRPTLLLMLLLATSLAVPGCRLLTGEVACARDRDCPDDAGIDFCDAEGDGGAGTCVEVDVTPEPDGGGGINLDAGFFDPNADAGNTGDGGAP